MLLKAVGGEEHGEAMANVTVARHYSRGTTGGQKLENTVRAQVLQAEKLGDSRRLVYIRCRRCSLQPGWSWSGSWQRLRSWRRSSPSSAALWHPANGSADEGSIVRHIGGIAEGTYVAHGEYDESSEEHKRGCQREEGGKGREA